jgi:hypothetical protein
MRPQRSEEGLHDEEVTMTTAMAREGRWSRGAEAAADSDVPSIAPNRRRLDRDTPNLAFTVLSRKPFVEVILATDRGLFDPNSAQRRTPQNFFASRSLGLTHMSGPDANYLVPTAVLRSFLEAQPRPREIFYTAIACDDQEGHAPVLASPVAQLIAHAPSVPLAADYTVQGLARSFGMALDRLVRHEAAPGRAASAPTPPVATRWQAGGAFLVPVQMAQGASDEAPSPPFERSEATTWGRSERMLDRDDDDDEQGEIRLARMGSTYDDGFGLPDDDGADGVDRDSRVLVAAAELGYDDGFGTEEGAGSDGPVGAEPAELPEDDHATSYGDEADIHAPAPALNGITTNGAPVPAVPVPVPPTSGAEIPSAAQLGEVLTRVAATLDGHSLYTMARRSDAGLRFGVGAFDQRSGALGRVLARMKTTDPTAFSHLFGVNADQLVAVTGAAAPQERMVEVGGKPLTDASWIQRFVAAGAYEPFTRVQNEEVVASALAPLWPVALGFGLTTRRAVAVVLVLAIYMGPQEAADWLAERLAPAHTESQIGTALVALGVPDLASFQRRAGLVGNGRIDAETKAALTFALRALGPSSPLPVLTPAQMLEAVLRHAGHGGLSRKLASLLEDRTLGGQPQ